ncbi:MAG: hypothetical protein WBM87_01205 [Woeseiaceae bacterium]
MAFFSLFKRRTAAAKLAEPAPIQTRPQYPGVEVIPGSSDCCAAVTVIAGRRLLADEAPNLPLANCNRPRCRCRYQQYDDRRADARRDADIGIRSMADLYNDSGRTSKPGRRSADQEND